MSPNAASGSPRPVGLKKHWFNILLALGDGSQHGYAIRDHVEAQTDGEVTLYPATLYGAIREMSGLGLIEALEGEQSPDDDQRRRYYELTELGRTTLRAEVERLQGLLDAARATRALGGA